MAASNTLLRKFSFLVLFVGLSLCYSFGQIEFQSSAMTGTFSCSVTPGESFLGETITAEMVVAPESKARITWSTDVKEVSGVGSAAQFTADRVGLGEHVITFTAILGKRSTTCSSHFRVRQPNPPTVGCSASPTIAMPGEPVTVSCSAVSPDNRVLTFKHAVPGDAHVLEEAGPNATVASNLPGTFEVTTSATDDRGLSSNATVSIAVEAPPPSPPPPAPAPPAKPIVVDIDYVTDRAPTTVKGQLFFTGARSADAKLRYGTALVTIPPGHRRGELEQPSFLVSALFDEKDESHYVTLKSLLPKSETEFFKYLKSNASDHGGDVLIFIHGYNVTFEDAALRLAQIKYDLQFAGPAVLYSWPSRGTTYGYPSDEESVQWSMRNFKPFLKQVIKQSAAKRLILIAHSMGNRLLASAMEALANESVPLSISVKEVILAAPDIDVGVFEQMSAAIHSAGSHVTIYESRKDRALQASRLFHSFPRVGDANPVHVFAGFDVMDASKLETDFLNHSYFAENGSILDDIEALIRGKEHPDDRRTWKRQQNGQESWWTTEP